MGKLTYQKSANLFHILLVVPVILVVAIAYQNKQLDKINPFWFTLLLMLGIAALGYHGYQFVK